jgi:hypothetical protein
MQESQVISGWMDRGKNQGVLERGREDLLLVVQRRLASPVPEDLRLAIEGTNDPDVLRRWLGAALDAATLEQFRAAMRQVP